MNRLELGRHWVARLCTIMPDAPQRVCIRMGWYLAALAIHNDVELFSLPDATLHEREGGSPHFVKLRMLYQQRLSAQDFFSSNVIAFTRPISDPPDKTDV